MDVLSVGQASRSLTERGANANRRNRSWLPMTRPYHGYEAIGRFAPRLGPPDGETEFQENIL